ncbi:MAG: AI-2E family transporter YdiK [Betaproteobacteria bacterium]|nr:AI-2E family transporter YdiK [Betaproteobacteria bacterium]
MENRFPQHDLPRILLSVLLIGLMIVGSLWVLRPFLPALIWAAMIVVATWPMLRALENRLRGRRWLACGIMVLTMLLLIIVPLGAAVTTLVESADSVKEHVDAFMHNPLPGPPEWVHTIPFAGERAAFEWRKLSDAGTEGLHTRLLPFTGKALEWLFARASNAGLLTLHFFLTLAMTAILYMHGEAAARSVIRFARRLAAQRGENTVRLAGQAIRAVALGIIVTAAVQSVLGGLALLICGVPGAGLLTALMFMLCIAQIGPLIVLAPAVGWLFWQGDTAWAIALLVFTLIIGSFDSVMRPLLIKRGADLPLLLILAGVIGGLLGFGFVGLFVGPVLLAVSYTLLDAWMAEQDQAAEPLQE